MTSLQTIAPTNKAPAMKAEPRSSSMSKAHSLLSMTSMSIRQDCSDLYQQVEHWRIKVQLWAKDHQCTCVYRNLNPESNQAVEAMDGALATAIRVPKVSGFLELPYPKANCVKFPESY